MRISSAKFLVASSVLTIAISCGSAYAFAENDPAASGPRTEVNIGAEPLEEALNKLAQQFGKQIVFSRMQRQDWSRRHLKGATRIRRHSISCSKEQRLNIAT